ncbi:ubiquitin thioesterase otubain-like [Amborella trichopoda]|uniref:ubiquitinyl hydrolase 1 n=1 Tax=Amborella trichopoda TaxID=13333 RepID=W1PDW8_AMBTC|nr:ubiquitin thioesterase otubain-like [Amborella trichopoda]ERN06143.1 hypothetical protein AMTR_s00016p00097180 [Amborella trichopoda]|eukprot:XP_006844468.1 ubiquitin thioesterase otubain-like [Amborella trichopoda]
MKASIAGKREERQRRQNYRERVKAMMSQAIPEKATTMEASSEKAITTEESSDKAAIMHSEAVAESVAASVLEDWSNIRDDAIIQQQNAIIAEEAEKMPFVGDKEALSALAAEYESGSSILKEKIKILEEKYAAIRRTRGDGNCFFRCFLFAYLEHVLESQDKTEVAHMLNKVEECKATLLGLGYLEFTFEDFVLSFTDLLEGVIQGTEASISYDELLDRSRNASISNYVVMFFRFVTSAEIKKRADFFEPFIMGLSNVTVEKFCQSSVEPMGEESDHVQIIALSDALGVPIRVVYLDNSSNGPSKLDVNHHDFIPSSTGSSSPNVTMLYRPGHYDILYPK